MTNERVVILHSSSRRGGAAFPGSSERGPQIAEEPRSYSRWIAGATLTLALVACARAEPPVLVPDPAPGAAATTDTVEAVADAGPAVDVAPAPAGDAATVTGDVGETPASALAPAAKAALDRALERYEALRKRLSADATDGLSADASALRDAVDEARKALGDAAPASVHDALTALSTAAGRGAPAELEPARAWFGDVSKALLAVGRAVPEVRAGRRVFSCPMTDHYRKWVQIGETVDNPLQGKRMLTCGEAADWSE